MVLNNAEDGHSQSVLPKDDDDDEEDCEIDLLTMECVPEETPVVVNVDEEDECEIDMETMQPLDPDKCLSWFRISWLLKNPNNKFQVDDQGEQNSKTNIFLITTERPTGF